MSFEALGIYGIIIPLLGIVVGIFLTRSIQRRSMSFVATVLTTLPVLIGGVGTFIGHQSVAASAGLPADVIAAGYAISWQTTYLGVAVSTCLVVLAIVAFVTHAPTTNDTDSLV